jgi:glycosyltransferase involved in cell wall biosynthesis
MPCYNEAFTLSEILRRVDEIAIDKEIIVVDDGSTDGTRGLLASIERRWATEPHPHSKLRVILQPKNRGKGAAVRTGIAAATGRITLIQDADLEYDPREFPRLVQPILDDVADVVFGSRFAGTPRRVLFYWHELGNRLLTTLSNALTDLNLTDMETCYKAFRTELIQSIPLEEDRFGFEPEVTAKIARMGVRIYEVPIGYHGRTYEEGKKIGWRDAVRALQVMWKYRKAGEATQYGREATAREQRFGGFNADLYERIAPHLGEDSARITEIGADFGQLSRRLLTRQSVVLTDPHPERVRGLRRMFRDHEHVTVEPWDLRSPPPPGVAATKSDTFVCVNLLQRLEDDAGGLSRVAACMPARSKLVLSVPAVPAAFGTLDRALGWHRRYSREQITDLCGRAGLTVESIEAAYFAALVGWWFHSRVMGSRDLPRGQVQLINNLLPPLARFGRMRPPVGHSWIVVARKA